MITFIVIIVYILIGIFVNYKYNADRIKTTREIFPILSNIIILALIILWPALISAQIECYFNNRNK